MIPYTITLPSKLKIVSEKDNSGTYEIEGLHPGYGHTLGNSLRRIILSSLSGVAITSIKIDGANHEFSTIEGVNEDVIGILLNLKKVRFSIESDEAQVVTINLKGPRKITAADIQTPGQVSVLTPDQYICEISNKANLSIEITVDTGIGFVPRDELQKEKVSIGVIPIDAIFSPIRKVHYEVQNMRVGDRTDHNRLRLTIQTDGSLSPREAFENAVTIMVKQLRSILDLKDIEESAPIIDEPVEASSDENEDPGEDITDILKTRVDHLELSTRTLNALEEANIRTIGGLVRKREEDVLALDGIGAKGVNEIKDALKDYNLGLKEA